VEPAATCTVSVAFSPTSTGAKGADLSLADNADDSPQAVALSGTGTTPGAEISPVAYGFGLQIIGIHPSATRVFTVEDTGTADLHIATAPDGITLAGADPSDFTVMSDRCSGATLLPGATCTVTVGYDPSASGTQTATLSVSDNAPASPQTTTLSGTAPVQGAIITPSTYDFGSQAVEASGTPTEAFTLTNTNTSPLSLFPGSATITGMDTTDFAITSDSCLDQTLQPAGTCAITVEFAPGTPGTHQGTLSVMDGAPNSPQTAALSGTGT
jgi:hypothetical protein